MNSIERAMAKMAANAAGAANAASEPRKTSDELLREEFPALQDAWEKYQIVYKMCKASKPKETSIQKADDILAQIRASKQNLGVV